MDIGLSMSARIQRTAQPNFEMLKHGPRRCQPQTTSGSELIALVVVFWLCPPLPASRRPRSSCFSILFRSVLFCPVPLFLVAPLHAYDLAIWVFKSASYPLCQPLLSPHPRSYDCRTTTSPPTSRTGTPGTWHLGCRRDLELKLRSYYVIIINCHSVWSP